MKLSIAVTVVLSLMIGCALSQEDMITGQFTHDSNMESSTAEACYDLGWSTTCECSETHPNVCGYTFTTVCDGVESSYKTDNMTRAECYVPGEWAEWAEWSECNVTCPELGGWRNRTHECDPESVEPWQHAVCNDSNVEWQACSCGEWAAWSEWSTCSVTCDGGIQTRYRDCQPPATVAEGAGVVCPGDAEEEDACGTDECPLDEEEAANGVYVGLVSSMTVDDYIKIRTFLQNAIISMINNWCYKTAFSTCCPDKSKPRFPKAPYVPEYVNSKTCELKGAFRDEGENTLYFFLMVNPAVDTCELCNGNASVTTTTTAATGRKRRQALSLAGSVTGAVASSSNFTSAVTQAAAANGFTVTVAPALSASAAQSLKASLATTTTAAVTVTGTVTVTTTRATAANPAPQQQLGLIIGFSVGGGLILIAIILVVVVVVKKKMAKTGIAEITASGDEGAAHHHERRHRELEDGNVAYPAPQYPAQGAVAPVSHS